MMHLVMPKEPMSITARYAAAQVIAVKAGRVAHDYFVRRGTLAIEAKGAQDFVSHADRAVEALIRAEIRREFPDDAFMGEESAAGPDGPPTSSAHCPGRPGRGTVSPLVTKGMLVRAGRSETSR